MGHKSENPENIALMALVMGGEQAIIESERRGQNSVVEVFDTLPTDGISYYKDALETLGFKIGEVYDDLFTSVVAPEGWSLVKTSHYMHNDIVDDKGNRRGSLAYKAAFYDRYASFNLFNRFYADVVRHADDELQVELKEDDWWVDGNGTRIGLVSEMTKKEAISLRRSKLSNHDLDLLRGYSVFFHEEDFYGSYDEGISIYTGGMKRMFNNSESREIKERIEHLRKCLDIRKAKLTLQNVIKEEPPFRERRIKNVVLDRENGGAVVYETDWYKRGDVENLGDNPKELNEWMEANIPDMTPVSYWGVPLEDILSDKPSLSI